MKKFLKISIVVIVVLALVSLFLIKTYGPNFNIYLFPPTVEEYVENAIKNMNNGINANSKEWANQKEKLLEESKNFEKYEDAHDSIEEAVKVAGGKHSFIIKPQDKNEVSKNIEYPQIELRDDGILYIKLTPIMLASEEENQKYVDIVVKELEKENYSGVILDLADNSGGDMYPMITAISSLIPDGEILEFKNAAGQITPIEMKSGQISSEIKGLNKKVKNVKVAVIINKNTGSSGEITALALKKNNNVRFFGEESAGYTSVNSMFTLYDGLIMMLTTSSIVDPLGNEYLNEKIKPDVYTKDPIKDASSWIIK